MKKLSEKEVEVLSEIGGFQADTDGNLPKVKDKTKLLVIKQLKFKGFVEGNRGIYNLTEEGESMCAMKD